MNIINYLISDMTEISENFEILFPGEGKIIQNVS